MLSYLEHVHRKQHELPPRNNSIEGWHIAFQANVSACHPTIYRFLDILKREESMARASILQALGHSPPQIRRGLSLLFFIYLQLTSKKYK